jgi:hypothetical protein
MLILDALNVEAVMSLKNEINRDMSIFVDVNSVVMFGRILPHLKIRSLCMCISVSADFFIVENFERLGFSKFSKKNFDEISSGNSIYSKFSVEKYIL